MDIFMPIVIFVLAVIVFTICGYCCKRKREGTVYGYGPSVTVTSTTAHQVPVQSGVAVGSPPYPLDPRHPTPQISGPPGLGFATHSAPYPTNTPYGQPAVAAPYPPAPGATPYPPGGGAAYPPAPYPSAADNVNPPPYDVAVSSPPVQPPAKEAYGKQSPYNPNYN